MEIIGKKIENPKVFLNQNISYETADSQYPANTLRLNKYSYSEQNISKRKKWMTTKGFEMMEENDLDLLLAEPPHKQRQDTNPKPTNLQTTTISEFPKVKFQTSAKTILKVIEPRKVSKSKEPKLPSIKGNKLPTANNLKKKKNNPIKVAMHMARAELSLFNFLIEKSTFCRVNKKDTAFYTHYSQDRDQNFEQGNYTYINRMPGFFELSNKNKTFSILNNYRRFHKEQFKFYPKTFNQPLEYDEYKSYHKAKPKEIFIGKIATGCHGYGCTILRKAKDLPESASTHTSGERVIQKYLATPLLMDNKKHDLRLYVTIVSYDPLVAFINKEGLARFCTEDYEEVSSKNKAKDHVHFSNYTLNKTSKNYIQKDECEEIHDGSKRSFKSYFKQLELVDGADCEEIWSSIKTVCTGVLKALKPYIQYACKTYYSGPKRGKCFHIIGIDVILDNDLKPYLLEINSNPSLNIDWNPDDSHAKNKAQGVFTREKDRIIRDISPIDLYVKKRVLGDIVKMLKKTKQSEIHSGEFTNYKSYEKLFDQTIEADIYSQVNEFDRMLEMFMFQMGVKFTPTLSSNKFSKCIRWFSGLGVKKQELIDGDIAFTRIENGPQGSVDYEGFIMAIYEQLDKAYGCELKGEEQQNAIGKLYAGYEKVSKK